MEQQMHQQQALSSNHFIQFIQYFENPYLTKQQRQTIMQEILKGLQAQVNQTKQKMQTIDQLRTIYKQVTYFVLQFKGIAHARCPKLDPQPQQLLDASNLEQVQLQICHGYIALIQNILQKWFELKANIFKVEDVANILNKNLPFYNIQSEKQLQEIARKISIQQQKSKNDTNKQNQSQILNQKHQHKKQQRQQQTQQKKQQQSPQIIQTNQSKVKIGEKAYKQIKQLVVEKIKKILDQPSLLRSLYPVQNDQSQLMIWGSFLHAFQCILDYGLILQMQFNWIKKNFKKSMTNQIEAIKVIQREFNWIAKKRNSQSNQQVLCTKSMQKVLDQFNIVDLVLDSSNHQQIIKQSYSILGWILQNVNQYQRFGIFKHIQTLFTNSNQSIRRSATFSVKKIFQSYKIQNEAKIKMIKLINSYATRDMQSNIKITTDYPDIIYLLLSQTKFSSENEKKQLHSTMKLLRKIIEKGEGELKGNCKCIYLKILQREIALQWNFKVLENYLKDFNINNVQNISAILKGITNRKKKHLNEQQKNSNLKEHDQQVEKIMQNVKWNEAIKKIKISQIFQAKAILSLLELITSILQFKAQNLVEIYCIIISQAYKKQDHSFQDLIGSWLTNLTQNIQNEEKYSKLPEKQTILNNALHTKTAHLMIQKQQFVKFLSRLSCQLIDNLKQLIIMLNLRQGKARIILSQESKKESKGIVQLQWQIKQQFRGQKPIGFDLVQSLIQKISYQDKPQSVHKLIQLQTQLVLKIIPWHSQNPKDIQILLSGFMEAKLQKINSAWSTQTSRDETIIKSVYSIKSLFLHSEQYFNFEKQNILKCLIQGKQKIKLNIKIEGKKFDQIIVGQNQLIFTVKNKISKLIGQKISQFKLKVNDKIDFFNGATVSQELIKDGSQVQVIKKQMPVQYDQVKLRNFINVSLLNGQSKIQGTRLLQKLKLQENSQIRTFIFFFLKKNNKAKSFDQNLLIELFACIFHHFPEKSIEIINQFAKGQIQANFIIQGPSRLKQTPRKIFSEKSQFLIGFYSLFKQQKDQSKLYIAKCFQLFQQMIVSEKTILTVCGSLQKMVRQGFHSPYLGCFIFKCLLNVLNRQNSNFLIFYQSGQYSIVFQAFITYLQLYEKQKKDIQKSQQKDKLRRFYQCQLFPIILQVINKLLLLILAQKTDQHLTASILQQNLFRISLQELESIIQQAKKSNHDQKCTILRLLPNFKQAKYAQQKQALVSCYIIPEFFEKINRYFLKEAIPQVLQRQMTPIISLLQNVNRGQIQSQMINIILSTSHQHVSQLYLNILYVSFRQMNTQGKQLMISALYNKDPDATSPGTQHHYELFAKCISLYFQDNHQKIDVLTKIVDLILSKFKHSLLDYSSNQNSIVKLQGVLFVLKSIIKYSKQIRLKIFKNYLQIFLSKYLFPVIQGKNQVGVQNPTVRKQFYELVIDLIKANQDFIPNKMFNYVLYNIVEKACKANISYVNFRKNRELPVGLFNPSNTCYLNSMIQSLFAIKPFVYAVCAVQTEDVFVSQLQRIFTNLAKSPFDSYDLSALFSTFHQPIDPNLQEDTCQFLIKLISRLEVVQNKDLNSVIKYLFTGRTKTVYRCINCDNKSQKVEDFLVFPIDIRGKNFLHEIFELQYFKEKIDDYKCQECKKQGCDKITSIIQTPNIFIVNLQRVTYDYMKQMNIKIHSKFQFPEDWLLKTNQQEKFSLKTLIIHQGSGMAGHYYVHTKLPDFGWTELNDSRVFPIEIKQIDKNWFGLDSNESKEVTYSTNATLLFYEKTKKAPLKQLKLRGQVPINVNYHQFPEFYCSKVLKQIQQCTFNSKLQQIVYSDQYSQDFITFMFGMIQQGNFQEKLLNLYILLGKVVFSCNKIPKITGVINIKDQDPSKIYSLLTQQQYNDYNSKMIFSDKPNLRFLICQLLINVISFYLNDPQRSSFGKQLANKIFSNNHDYFVKNYCRSDGYLKIIKYCVSKTSLEGLQFSMPDETQCKLQFDVQSYFVDQMIQLIKSSSQSELPNQFQYANLANRALQILLIRADSKNVEQNQQNLVMQSQIENPYAQKMIRKLIIQKTANYQFIRTLLKSISDMSIFSQFLQLHPQRGSLFFEVLIQLVYDPTFCNNQILSRRYSQLIKVLLLTPSFSRHWGVFFGNSFPIINFPDNRMSSLNDIRYQYLSVKRQNFTLFGLLVKQFQKLNNSSPASRAQYNYDHLLHTLILFNQFLVFLSGIEQQDCKEQLKQQIRMVKGPRIIYQNIIHYIKIQLQKIVSINGISIQNKFFSLTHKRLKKISQQTLNSIQKAKLIYPNKKSVVYGGINQQQRQRFMKQFKSDYLQIRQSQMQQFFCKSEALGWHSQVFKPYVHHQAVDNKGDLKNEIRQPANLSLMNIRNEREQNMLNKFMKTVKTNQIEIQSQQISTGYRQRIEIECQEARHNQMLFFTDGNQKMQGEQIMQKTYKNRNEQRMEMIQNEADNTSYFMETQMVNEFPNPQSSFNLMKLSFKLKKSPQFSSCNVKVTVDKNVDANCQTISEINFISFYQQQIVFYFEKIDPLNDFWGLEFKIQSEPIYSRTQRIDNQEHRNQVMGHLIETTNEGMLEEKPQNLNLKENKY